MSSIGRYEIDREIGRGAMGMVLVGDWTGTTKEGRSVKVTYRSISNGTCVEESIHSTDAMDMVSVYCPDRDGVMMTHYCASNNQPRMRTRGLGRRRAHGVRREGSAEPGMDLVRRRQGRPGVLPVPARRVLSRGARGGAGPVLHGDSPVPRTSKGYR